MPISLIIPLTKENETKLRSIMQMQSLDSLEAAFEYALNDSERRARVKRLLDNASPDEAWGEAFDPNYDLEAIRKMDTPRYSSGGNDAAA